LAIAFRGRRGEDVPPGVGGAGGVVLGDCGTSYHAALVFRYLLEERCGVPARVEYA